MSKLFDRNTLSELARLATQYSVVTITEPRQAGKTTLAKLGSACGVDEKTVKAWLSVLKASYIVYLLKPHHENFRKRAVIYSGKTLASEDDQLILNFSDLTKLPIHD